jgi:hypothetical protein
MKLSECRSLDDIKRFRDALDGTAQSGWAWYITKEGFVMTLLPTEWHIILTVVYDKFIWRDNKGESRYEDLYNSEHEAKKVAYLEGVKRARERVDKTKEELDWLLANPPKDD